MRVLIVDDGDISRAKMVAILSEYGQCDTADCGPRAIALFEEALDSTDPYDLVTMDVEMPQMSGQETLEAMRIVETERCIDPWDGVRIVMVTSHRDPDNFLESFKAGCKAYIVKPATREAVKDKLEKLGLLAGADR